MKFIGGCVSKKQAHGIREWDRLESPALLNESELFTIHHAFHQSSFAAGVMLSFWCWTVRRPNAGVSVRFRMEAMCFAIIPI